MKEALQRVPQDKPSSLMLLMTFFMFTMLCAATMAPAILHFGINFETILTTLLLAGLAGTAMSCDQGGKKAKASTRVSAKKAEDKGCLDLAVEFASFKRCFAAAKLIGDEKSLLNEYRQCYGYRADLIGLVWQAFNEVCGKK